MRDRRRKLNPKRKTFYSGEDIPGEAGLPSSMLSDLELHAANEKTNIEHKEIDLSGVINRNGTVSLTKSDLGSLEIIGQFNLGFILARSEDGNLWILDQHACDERSNFEKLSNETIFHEQKLIAPMPLELSPSQESTVQNNMEIFEANGFRFVYDENKPPQHRFSLTAVPHR
jgi:DNA mismatch repair protein PMS2